MNFPEKSPLKRKVLGNNYSKSLHMLNAHIMLLVIISIFSCDFSFFPPKHLKTKEYGTSLMDLGTGSFLCINGTLLVKLSKMKVLRRAIMNAILGSFRLGTIMYFNYDVEITEYGKHMNFYFTLSAIYLIYTIFEPKNSTVLALFILKFHQILLCKGLDSYIFSESRNGLLSSNKEGIFSILPYFSILLLAKRTGKIFFSQANYTNVLFRVFYSCIPLLYGYLFSLEISESSRRLANIPYAFFIVFFYTFNLGLCLLLLTFDVKLLNIQRYCSENMLFLFLWSNILVLVFNLCFNLKGFLFFEFLASNIFYLILVFFLPIILSRFYLKYIKI